MFSLRSLPLLLTILTILLLAPSPTSALPPRRALQLQHAAALSKALPSSGSGAYNKAWKPAEESNGVKSNVVKSEHVKCGSTALLLECRDTCYTTYGPYSGFYGDCLDCCRKVCDATAYCPADIDYWRKKKSGGIAGIWGGGSK